MSRTLQITALVIAGEMIFGLPFHTARFFRPTFLDAFDFTNTQLGDLFAAYGVTAMLSYYLGGALADRFSARGLLTTSLIATAAGGLYMAVIPNAVQMAALYGYFGVTTILLFWAALIRATREWGGPSSQGLAFGILDGGRGLAAALFGAFCVAVLASHLPDDPTLATDEERRQALRYVILLYSAATLLSAVLTWFFVPRADVVTNSSNPLANMGIVLRRPVMWGVAGVIICAYCGYKGLDNYALYAVDVLGMNEVEAAQLATYGAYTRLPAALAAGLLADRIKATWAIGLTFLVLLFAFTVLGFATPETAGWTIIYGNIYVSFIGVFALRGVYYALLQEMHTPRSITGSATGMVAFIGYTPEIFFAPIAGRILDAAPGVEGHLNFFKFLAAISLVGIAVVAWLLWLEKPARQTPWPAGMTAGPPVNRS